ncbi:MAG: response regulator [Balneolaceae bacterium]|nr:response regulator [Balneolaceae bacterium]
MNKARVLIVEDEMIQSMVLESMITEFGYQVVGKARTGREAIDLALELEPDIITMDISLNDDIDGITAAQQIQDVSQIPVIYITGNTDRYNYQRAIKTYYIDILSKPINKKNLQQTFIKAVNPDSVTD